MKKILLSTLSFLPFILYAQSDTLYINNQKIIASVKEITPDAVKYIFPGEDLVNSAYKNTIQKIVFKNGRIQIFAETTSYKEIKGVKDYDKVTTTSVENEVKGLFKISDVSSKAVGGTVYSSQERVKDRAYRKIKIQAAMFGANVIYLTNQRTEGNKYGGYFSASSTAETNLTGIAYSNTLPDFEKFKTLIGDKTAFVSTNVFELGSSDSDVSEYKEKRKFKVSNIVNENGIIIIEGTMDGARNITRFQVANLDTSQFSVAYKNKGDVYNIVFNY